MKKIITLALALVLALSLAACSGTSNSGNDGNSTTTPPASNNGGNSNTDTPESIPSADSSKPADNSPAGILAIVGLTEDDIALASALNTEVVNEPQFGGDYITITITVPAYDDHPDTPQPEMETLVTQLFNATKAASDDKKNYGNYTDSGYSGFYELEFSDGDFWLSSEVTDWYFLKNGCSYNTGVSLHEPKPGFSEENAPTYYRIYFGTVGDIFGE
jgi:hypothetical protein